MLKKHKICGNLFQVSNLIYKIKKFSTLSIFNIYGPEIYFHCNIMKNKKNLHLID